MSNAVTWFSTDTDALLFISTLEEHFSLVTQLLPIHAIHESNVVYETQCKDKLGSIVFICN